MTVGNWHAGPVASDGLESAADSSDASEVEQADRDVPAGAERRREQLERAVLSGREP